MSITENPANGVTKWLAPIAVMSFNRPDYLRQTLAALVAQRQDLRRRLVVLFQDGAVNPLSRRRRAKDADIAAAVAVFTELVPWGEVRLSPHNLGVALNFRRAEAELFADPLNEIVYFFEDDMVVHPAYLDLLDRVAEATENLSRPVGYFAAYGALREPIEVQERERRYLRRLAHHWAFGLRRSHWQRMQPLMARYYALTDLTDYARHSGLAIAAELRRHGVVPVHTTQDDVKKAISYALGAVSLNTMPAAARYIGARGIHMTPETFARQGWNALQVRAEVEADYIRPAPDELDRLHKEEMLHRETFPARIRRRRFHPATLLREIQNLFR